MFRRLLLLLLTALWALPAGAQIPGPAGLVINGTPIQNGTLNSCLTVGAAGRLSQTALCGAAAGLTVGTSPIAGGTNTRVLYDNAGVLGEYTISGTGSVAMTTSPSFTTPALGVAAGTSLALGGATIGSNVIAATGSMNISGAATFGGIVTVPNGSITAPSLNFTSETTTGLYRGSNQTIATGNGGAASTPFAVATSGGTAAMQFVNSGTSTNYLQFVGSTSFQAYVNNVLALTATPAVLTVPTAVAVGGAAIGGNVIAATGSMNISGAATFGGIVTVPGGANAALTSSSAWNDGAAAAVGTLTNAPIAGNPTKWVAFDDNGTTRYVPMW